MSKKILRHILIKWTIASLGLWVASGLLGGHIQYGDRLGVIVVAGLILTLVNMLVKPLVIFLSLPALFLTLGLFMVVINGLMVLLVSVLYSSLEVTNFWFAMLAGMIIGLVNYLVVTILEDS